MTVAVVGLVCSDQLSCMRAPCVSLARFPSQLGSTLVTATLCAFDLSFVHASAGTWKLAMQGARQASESGWEYSECTACVVCS